MRKSIGAATFIAMVFTALSASGNQTIPTNIPTAWKAILWPSGLVSVYKLPAVPGFGLLDILVLWWKILDLHTDGNRTAGDLTRCGYRTSCDASRIAPRA